MSLSNIRPYESGFLIFSDYARPAIRLGALMEIPTIHSFTHDSIGVGDDGPMHRTIEQLASLRAISGLIILRLADANEVVEAWRVIMVMRNHPVALILSRQDLPTLDRDRYQSAAGVARSAYVLADAESARPDVLLMATGSEVSMFLAAYEQLKADGIAARVISVPSWELSEQQDQAYKIQSSRPDILACVAVKMASSFGWAN